VLAGTVEERMQQRAEKKLFLEQMVSRGSTKAAEAGPATRFTATSSNFF
jgi:hypothetical protein